MNKEETDKEIAIIYEKLLNEYFNPDLLHTPFSNNQKESKPHFTPLNFEIETQRIKHFLSDVCACGNNCQALFTLDELRNARVKFHAMPTIEKNCFILSQLMSFSRHSTQSYSARTSKPRKRQKFEYHVSADRPICKTVFLFYYGETIERLKRLQKNFYIRGIELPVHGNKGSQPVHACSHSERETVKLFIINFSTNQGLPDPGRDVRKGKGKLRIFLPSVMSYLSVHQVYQTCMIAAGHKKAVGYRTFIRIWQEDLSYIVFSNPKTDLCMQCEDFKKQINQVTAILNEEKEDMQAKIYKEALNHLNHAKKERLYYRAHAQLANENYQKMRALNKKPERYKANSLDTMMHYSWDFAQQLHYPFEDHQVGPIYFKTPRRAQLFGVCCEGIPKQINYLIDEADFLEKNANTVISLLDHFFAHHALGETSVYLTADNCVGQNKNNALIQYLMYRVLTGLHTNIELSFLVVGHTKFSPDGYFGLIRHRYRRSKIYTYEQLAKVVEDSSPNGHNICQTYSGSNQPAIIYRNWSDWLAQYFKVIPGITAYHHFQMSSKNRGEINLKNNVDSKVTTLNLLNESDFPYSKKIKAAELPLTLKPKEMSAERQWYLYEQIRAHIPDAMDKDKTCPKPDVKKPPNI